MDKFTISSSQDNARQIRRITWIGLGLNLFLSGIKFVVGILGSSQAVIADAFHSLSDMITDISVLFGVTYWSAPPDENHPYGHHRYEAMITSFIGFVLVAIALGLGYNAIGSVRESQLSSPGMIAITGSVFSIIFKEIVFHWTYRIGKRTKSAALIANAWHHRSDALSSIPVLAAVILANINPNLAYVDQIGALVVSIFILKVSWSIIKPSLKELADHGASEEDRKKIESIAMDVSNVKEVHAIRSRKTGPGFHVDMHVLVDPDMTVKDGHDIAEEVAATLIKKGPDIFDVVVHLEPYETKAI
jgi:cation diffusion facilitator family transporter